MFRQEFWAVNQPAAMQIPLTSGAAITSAAEWMHASSPVRPDLRMNKEAAGLIDNKLEAWETNTLPKKTTVPFSNDYVFYITKARCVEGLLWLFM